MTTADLYKENMLVRVTFTGGLIGLLAGSPFWRIDSSVKAAIEDGWNLAEVIPDTRNLLIWILRLVILICTFGLWTLASGYILIMERPAAPPRRSDGRAGRSDGRPEPLISAKR